jgi:hypothetical protein
VNLNPKHPALSENRTIHTKRTRDVETYKGNVLKPASLNKKLGDGSDTIVKGKWKGMPMYSLTLEERATCPDTCIHWRDCYGNGMAFAHRFKPGEQLESRLRMELAALAAIHPHGFVVRLHVLGDFYSLPYVELWNDALVKYPNLHIFGYTAREPKDQIGFDIILMGILFRDRCWIRQSVQSSNFKVGQYAVAEPSEVSITCPQQLGKTRSCLTCGLCWSVNLPIHFVNHDTIRKEKRNETHNQGPR